MREAGDQGKGGETADTADTEHQTFPDNASISDLESELQTDQSVLGSPFDPSTGINKGPRLPFLCCFSLFLSLQIFSLFYSNLTVSEDPLSNYSTRI